MLDNPVRWEKAKALIGGINPGHSRDVFSRIQLVYGDLQKGVGQFRIFADAGCKMYNRFGTRLRIVFNCTDIPSFGRYINIADANQELKMRAARAAVIRPKTWRRRPERERTREAD